MSSERTRSAPLLVPEGDVARVLRRAAELERDRGVGSPAGLTLEELEVIAREAGLDPANVREAARELAARRAFPASPFLGAATRTVLERVVEAEPTPETEAALVQEVRAVLDLGGRSRTPARVERLGRVTTLTGSARGSAVVVELLPSAGRTILRIRSDARSLAGGLFGGVMGGLGGGVGTHVGWMLPVLLHQPVVAGVAGAAVTVALSWGLARTLFVQQRRALDAELRALADRLEQRLRAG